jgi:hypothetical protein
MAVDLLLIAALNNGVVPASCGDTWKMAGQAKFQGAAYVNGCISESGQGGVEGPAIADGYSISGQGSYYQALGTNSLPPGAPVNSVTTSTSVQTTATVTYTTATTIFGSTTVETPISRPMWGQLATSWRQLK